MNAVLVYIFAEDDKILLKSFSCKKALHTGLILVSKSVKKQQRWMMTIISELEGSRKKCLERKFRRLKPVWRI